MGLTRQYALSVGDIDRLIRDIETVQKNIELAPEQIAEKAAERAKLAFDTHLGDATPGRQAVITSETKVEKRGKHGAEMTLTATGKTEDTGFNILMAVEFGAGIAGVNGFSNTSFELGMGTGTWPGQTHAFDPNGWVYPTGEYDENGKEIYRRTLGTPATMPMHKTIQDMKQELGGIASEVIGQWLI